MHHRVLQLTLTQPPTAYGVTHWSSRLLAAALAAEGTPISHVTIARIWHRFGVQPWRAQTFKFSTDPELEGKIRDVVGIPASPERQTFDYVRHGTTTLFAALGVTTGKVTDA